MNSTPSQGHDHSPNDILLPYQRDWVFDQSRFKIGLWARQTGKSMACAAEAVERALGHPGTEWIVLSAGERQAGLETDPAQITEKTGYRLTRAAPSGS